MLEHIASLIIESSFWERLLSYQLWFIFRGVFFLFFSGLELMFIHLFSWYGAYIWLLFIVFMIAWFIKQYKQKILFSLGISQILLWICFFIFSKIDFFEGGAFNFDRNWWFPLGIPFMRICPTCGSDVPPLWTFPYFLVNRSFFFLLSYVLVLFLPKKLLNSRIWQWSVGILSFFLVFIGIGWLGILYD